MRILYISNNSDYNYKKCPRGSVAMPYLFHKRGHEVLALGKKQLLHFYSFYRAFKPDVIVATWIPSGFLPVVFKKLGLIKCPIVHAWDDYYAEQMTKYRFVSKALPGPIILSHQPGSFCPS
ncbi:MAG: hypothetical protein MUF61_02870 [archaeon]|nr:hypothetical protein [archaeon]